ncbi:hypothetical protein [Salibacter halophilus]|uniref:Uncharacterized protein n=1 Tax=Salibacter halophilus TaxID=1803916 RepID=A0A6N6M835_9FLAO|nr:hypothetical protein [Salibacter halophilus]KAB1066064.1 hypothetical protein F3059_00930 [Salibacter halophilus]
MIGTILGIGGIVLTLIFGVYTIWTTKKSQKKVSIGLEKKECYSLFKKEINRLNIDVNYAGNSIDNYLILFKGTLVNNGHKDIDKSSVYKPLRIKSKNEFKWLESSLSEVPQGATVDLNKLDDTTLEIKWDLLKKGEQIEFETLIEIPQETEIEDISDEFYNSLDFDFRITDVNNVDKLSETFPKEKKKIRRKRKLLIMGVFTFIAGLYILFSPELPEYLSLFKDKKEIHYLAQYGNENKSINVTPNSEGQVIVQNGDNEEELSVEDFNKQISLLKIDTVVSQPDSFLFNRIMGIIYLLTSIMAFILFFKIKLSPTMAKKS